LKFEDRVAIEEIYWKVFGTSNVINNEIPAWIVCGFIAQGKGVDINWVKATESTTKEEACRDDTKGGGRLTTVKKKNVHLTLLTMATTWMSLMDNCGPSYNQ
jgi:hypothetical protein